MALFHVRYYSELNSYDTDMDVIIPEEANEKSYPVLFLLHDIGGNQTSWQRHTSIERYATENGFAAIMPSGLDRWYTDVPAAGGFFDNYSRFFVYELISICRSFFPQLAPESKGCFIGGAGMGGYGALKLALSHPDIYRGAFSIDGCVDIVKKAAAAKNAPFENSFANVFGGDPEKIAGTGDDLFALAGKAKAPGKFLLACGSGGETPEENKKLAETLKGAGRRADLLQYPGEPSWQAWDEQLKRIVKSLADEKAATPPQAAG